MTLQEKIDALPPWANEISLGGLEEDRNTIDLWAALARLALAREWMEDAPHHADCTAIDGVSFEYREGLCSCGRDALLKALEVKP